MKIKTLKDEAWRINDIEYACKLCNDLARLNMNTSKDVFRVENNNIITLIGTSYANGNITSGIYAVLFIVDQMDSSTAYTCIGYDTPLSINVTNVAVFIDKLKTL